MQAEKQPNIFHLVFARNFALARFVTPEGKVWGRPVGITVAKDGSVLISEDGDKTLWRVSYIK